MKKQAILSPVAKRAHRETFKAKMIELMELLKIQVLIQKELMEKQKRKFVFIYNKIVRRPIHNKILIYIH